MKTMTKILKTIAYPFVIFTEALMEARMRKAQYYADYYKKHGHAPFME